MMTYNFGDILLIRFPFTNQSRMSKRPALVLYDDGDMDILLCRVTTRPCFSVADLILAYWKESGLLKKSYIRLGKMATIQKDMVDKKLGQLLSADLMRIKNILRQMFDL
jgi:PemK-like, MazF-like toxin of type II toxin-antitoxin system